MKRYIRSNEEILSESEIQKIADDILKTEYSATAKWYGVSSYEIYGDLLSYNGQPFDIDKDGHIRISGYYGLSTRINAYDANGLNRNTISQKFDWSIQDIVNEISIMKATINKVSEIKPYLADVEKSLAEHFAHRYDNVKVTSRLYDYNSDPSNPSWLNYEYPYFKLSDWHDEPRYDFTVTLDDISYTQDYGYTDIKSGEATSKFIKYIAKQMKRDAKKSSRKGNKYVAILQEHNIDTTMQEYELYAEEYERYESGEIYKKKFKCNGDYLAYFSMCVHGNPTPTQLSSRIFNNEDEFEDFIERVPTVKAMKKYASESWFGDGDDYIIYLKNLTTGKTLYKGQ